MQGYQAIIMRLPRTAPRQLLESVTIDLDELWREIRDVLETFVNSKNLNANESQTDRHKQNSNTEARFESENGLGNKDEASGSAEETDNVRSLPKRDLPLGIVLDACPNMIWLAKDAEIRSWRDFLAAAETARPMLGVSPSAWEDAKTALGERDAAITLAAIYQRHHQINSAGGYLRSLTDRARNGKFSTWPMVMALLRAKLDAAKSGKDGVEEAEAGLATATAIERSQGRLEISDALRRSLGQSAGNPRGRE
jgi:replication initiation protein RepC